ncbi:MAG: prepilin-type N-terminal cleavage/methylation domain-containing protein [Gammaproteobacteria bacterium]
MSATGSAQLRAACVGRQAGFTLMELLVVIAILVLLTSALPLAFDRALPGRRVVVTTQKLLSAIRDAQSLSIASGRPVRLVFDGSALSGERVSVKFPATTRVELKDAEGLTLRAVAAYPEGTLTEARITVSERTYRRALRLSGLTGRITVEVPTYAQ